MDSCESEESFASGALGVSTLDAKLVLLGDTGVGKTSFALRFVKGVFNERTPPTVGASFLTKAMILPDVKIKLRLWDTAGQERFRSLAPMYYRNAVAAILVFDITRTNSFEKMKGWVKELQLNISDDIVIIIVGNKSDMAPYRKVSISEAKDYANAIEALGYVEVSAKTGDGVEVVFLQIAKELRQRSTTSSTNRNGRPPPEAIHEASPGVDVKVTKPNGGGCCG